MNTFTKKIESILKEFDDKEIESVIASIPTRRQSRRNSIDKQVRGSFNYPEVWSSCGGKGWYKLLEWCDKDLIEILNKDHQKKVSERNAKIAKKLTDAGVKEIIDGVEQYKQGGFEGTWFFQTDAGKKRIEIQVILAGGYIQCLHNRVLVKIK